MKVFGSVLAAGRSERFGGDKTEAMLGGRPVWRWAVDTFLAHPQVDGVILASTEAKAPTMRAVLGDRVTVVIGGASRQDSSLAALDACPDADILLIHDAARPFVSLDLITRTIDGIQRSGAAAVALPVTDTIKRVTSEGVRTLDRSALVAMQTPQGARTELLRRAHATAAQSFTDEMAMLEAQGVTPEIVAGEYSNFKITTPEDLERARRMVGPSETRTGMGYDVHSFSIDPGRKLFLGGVVFPDHPGLEGHSDADVLLHAVTDALLGAAALGDIGQHFPNTDPRWEGQASMLFLRHAAQLLGDAGWRVVNLDATVIAETPRVMPRAPEIRTAIAGALDIDVARVSVKATTNERLGFIGRGEGIAALAMASISR